MCSRMLQLQHSVPKRIDGEYHSISSLYASEHLLSVPCFSERGCKPHGRQPLFAGSGSVMFLTRFCIIAVNNFKNAHCLSTKMQVAT